jgi:MFS family permease
MDTSSELIHSLLPVFVVGVLGASALQLGLIEGVAEATAAFTRLVSGAFSDRLARRKPLILLGYGFAALTKPLFPLASGPGTVLLARFLDRIGKGIRGAPRDALIADVTPLGLRGRAYGFRQALDTAGAVAGPLLAVALVPLFAGDLRSVLWCAVPPALLAVLLVAVGIEEPARAAAHRQTALGLPLQRRDLAQLPASFWAVLALASLGHLARGGEAFLLLRLADLGLGAGLVPLGLVAMNLVYSAAAWPCGVLADRLDRRRLLALAFALLALAALLLALAQSLACAFAGILLFGLHMAASQGLLAALVADAAPAELRGTAFGLYHLFTGVALLAAGLTAGLLWDHGGPALTFAFAALLALLAAAGFGVGRWPKPGS